ncbi:hypothetical protein LJD47_24710, partial [Escherichia coli]|nr:hypothetical protein [Escherichia coli]
LDHPWIQEYFKGPRGRAAIATQETQAQAHQRADAHPTEVKVQQLQDSGAAATETPAQQARTD